jgi:hypothetical protein
LKAPLLGDTDGHADGEMKEFAARGGETHPLLPPASKPPVQAVKFFELFRYAEPVDRVLLVAATCCDARPAASAANR